MKKIPAILAAIAVCVAACTSPRTVADDLADASSAMADEDYTRAGTICQQIMRDYPMDRLPASALCQMAVTLIKVSEHTDAEENAAAAVRCYHYVMKEMPDSAAVCWGNMPSEDFQYVFLLNNLNTSLTAASDGSALTEE